MGHLLSSVNREASDAIQPDPQARRLPGVGELVIYHMRHGHARQGRTRFPALVQQVSERGSLGLTVILEAGELRNETLVEEIGAGGDIGHVWERPDNTALAEVFRGTITSLHTRIGELETRVAGAEKVNEDMRKCVLGEFAVPKVSIIGIMVDFENRLRAIGQENSALREAIGPKGKSKKK
jgi:hypothetical protein